jgi:hypothetical protein
LRAFFDLFDRSTVERRGLELLHAHLSPAQCAEFSASRRFEVRGGDTGRRYVVRSEASINIDQLDAEGECVRRWCFAPRGHLARGDVLLAQKLALECFELEALSVASSYPAQDLW